jgi:phosphoribosylaminoimidazole-succinocarboxamide synthase
MKFATFKKSLPRDPIVEVESLPWPKICSGKVREIYDLGDKLLIIATDRISAFDVVLPEGIPNKGIILTHLSLFWFKKSQNIIENHLVENHDESLKDLLEDYPHLILRSMLVKKLNPLPVEAVVRGYLSGSGWKSYKEDGSLFGQILPKGLEISARLPNLYFTPTTKATSGHDEPISLAKCEGILGKTIYNKVLIASMAIYQLGVDYAKNANIILADTKFEFGLDKQGKLFVIDEVLTPDSSRYWPESEYKTGRNQPSYDKQYVRDYLETLDWNKKPPGPHLPESIVAGTQKRYLTAIERLIS